MNISTSGELFAVLFVVGCIAFLVFAIWGRWKTIAHNQIGTVIRFGRQAETRFPGPVHLWPWEKIKLYPRIEIEIDIPPVQIPLGGETPLEATVDPKAIIIITDAEKAYMAPDHEPQLELQRLVAYAVTSAMSGILPSEIATLNREKIGEQIKTKLREDAERWGIIIIAVRIEGIHPPQAILDASEEVVRAQADAKATQLRSQAEVEAFERERKSQGSLYGVKQMLDAFIDAAKAGGVKALSIGGDAVAALTGLLATQEEGIGK